MRSAAQTSYARGLSSAYAAGVKAAQAGFREGDNPYKSQGYALSWRDGHRDETRRASVATVIAGATTIREVGAAVALCKLGPVVCHTPLECLGTCKRASGKPEVLGMDLAGDRPPILFATRNGKVVNHDD